MKMGLAMHLSPRDVVGGGSVVGGIDSIRISDHSHTEPHHSRVNIQNVAELSLPVSVCVAV